jgi:hypothetical protein
MIWVCCESMFIFWVFYNLLLGIFFGGGDGEWCCTAAVLLVISTFSMIKCCLFFILQTDLILLWRSVLDLIYCEY